MGVLKEQELHNLCHIQNLHHLLQLIYEKQFLLIHQPLSYTEIEFL